jgi:hypothetical protein
MSRVFFLVSIVSIVSIGVSLGVSASAGENLDSHALLRHGVALAREASFPSSVAALEQARTKGGLSAAESADCAYWLATGYLAMGSTQAARRELRALISDSPGYELPPFTSPKVAALYHEVKEELEKAPRLRALPPKQRREGLSLYFEPSRTGGTAYGAVYWRWQGESRWNEVALVHLGGGENLTARLDLQRGGTLEYWAEMRAPDGMASAGTRERPLELPVTAPVFAVESAPAPVAPPRKDSIAKKWWLWASLGAISAAGLGVGLYFALRPQPAATADAVLDFQVR